MGFVPVIIKVDFSYSPLPVPLTEMETDKCVFDGSAVVSDVAQRVGEGLQQITVPSRLGINHYHTQRPTGLYVYQGVLK